MGYRSEVKIVCENKAFEMFKAAWEKHNFKPQYIGHNEEYDYYSFGWDWVKWDEGYPEIEAIENVKIAIDDMEDTDGYSYRYVRLGEDCSDIDMEECGDADLPYIDVRIVVEDCIEFEKWEEE